MIESSKFRRKTMRDKNTQEKSLMKVNNSIFSKIKNFFMNIFKKKEIQQYVEERNTKNEDIPNPILSNFSNEMKIEEKKPNIKLLKMKNDLMSGKIIDEDLCEQELTELKGLLTEEIEQKNISINNYKNKILNIRKQLA